MPSRLTEDKRRYLIAVYIQEANFLIRWLSCHWAWFRDKYKNHVRNKVNNMTEGEVLREYYRETRKETDYGEDDFVITRVTECADK